ncbi:SprT family zinc-dependent metalloprotease [Pseudoxanthomonas sp. JBR18]|uniref:M48 family metallopeptidase n=1 Tax=Pseudoxanthomonas sp. JBR18 TaxID=2969308 RepID=UPI0023050357|nr:SprT family zinc-dependent metalloprotease [Pseudoxanthomonas sp. JBR18]WCE05506.1 SprT family zinc-dependent metalloprotease [Pseudoxanthomonas sp. JBR18]
MLLRRLTAKPPRSVERDTIVVPARAGAPPIEVQRVRDPRARRIRLSVDERGARLTLPSRASLLAGERFLEEHHQWLCEQLARSAVPETVQPLRPHVTPSLPLRGQDIALHWRSGRYTRLDLHEDGLHLQWPERASQATLVRTLRSFYETQAMADVQAWTPRHLPGLPRAPGRVRFKIMSSQWGSLSPDGSMALDLSLVLARPSAFEYVLVHELCHLAQANHSPAFWAEVQARFPDWRAERAYFHEHGRILKAQLRTLLQS